MLSTTIRSGRSLPRTHLAQRRLKYVWMLAEVVAAPPSVEASNVWLRQNVHVARSMPPGEPLVGTAITWAARPVICLPLAAVPSL